MRRQLPLMSPATKEIKPSDFITTAETCHDAIFVIEIQIHSGFGQRQRYPT